jgi:hypothetical protein
MKLIAAAAIIGLSSNPKNGRARRVVSPGPRKGIGVVRWFPSTRGVSIARLKLLLSQVPRDFWLEEWEKQAIIGFHLKNPLEGYRRLTFMMLDADIVAVSPSSVRRVLSQTRLLSKWNGKPSKKGTGFAQPLAAHQHWHIDVSYLNIGGTFYHLCSILDGYSRYHSELGHPSALRQNPV